MHGDQHEAFYKAQGGGMKRFLAIIVIAAVVIWVGAGCKSLPGQLEVDTPFFDIEYIGEPE